MNEVVHPDGFKWKNISAGGNYSLAIDENGEIWTWGVNENGQLGNGTKTFSNAYNYIPNKIVLPLENSNTKFKNISAGDVPLALDENNNLRGWSYIPFNCTQHSYRLYESPEQFIPIKLPMFQDNKKIVSIASGSASTAPLIMDEDGNVWSWGYANYLDNNWHGEEPRIIQLINY